MPIPRKITSARKLKEQKTGAVLPQTLQFDDDKWRTQTLERWAASKGLSVLQLEETRDD